MTNYDAIEDTKAWIEGRIDAQPAIALILGSGLGALADELDARTIFPYEEVPNWPTSAVEGHAGNLVFGKLGEVDVVVMQGRSHYYEGWTAEEVTFPVRVFAALGTGRILVTNSAGGINPNFSAGDLMLITDHINMTGYNPLRGENDDRLGPRFPDMSEAYSHAMRDHIIAAARELNIPLQSGVYAGVAGPSYETPAEVRMLGKMGGDAVGMSTVPEVIVANHAGMEVGGISCITNLAAGISATKLNHEEVKETAALVRESFAALVKSTVARLG
jgi:purine-nucleoside phosphorylase